MVTNNFTFLSTDGKTAIHAVKWIPDSGEYHGILQITHGMVEYIERYEAFAEYLTERGYMVVGHDHIGHGASVLSEEDWGFFHEEAPSDTLVEDMHKLRCIIQEDHSDLPYFMMGHSMGSFMLRKYLAIHGEQLKGAIIMGTGYKKESLVNVALTLAKTIGKIKGSHYRSPFMTNLVFDKNYKAYDMTGKNSSNSWLTKDEEIVKKYYSDPRCTFMFTINGYQGLFEAIKFSSNVKNIQRIPKELPVFFVAGKEDPVGDCGEAVKHVYDLFKLSGKVDVEMKLYEKDRHEILNEVDKQVVFEDIYNWMNKRI